MVDSTDKEKHMSGNDEIRNANDGSKTDGTEWADLVALYHPLFEDKKGWQDLSGEEWVDILSSHRQFEGKCDWSKLDERDWVRILSRRPELVGRFDPDKCDWSKLDGNDWETSSSWRRSSRTNATGRNWASVIGTTF